MPYSKLYGIKGSLFYIVVFFSGFFPIPNRYAACGRKRSSSRPVNVQKRIISQGRIRKTMPPVTILLLILMQTVILMSFAIMPWAAYR